MEITLIILALVAGYFLTKPKKQEVIQEETPEDNKKEKLDEMFKKMGLVEITTVKGEFETKTTSFGEVAIKDEHGRPIPKVVTIIPKIEEKDDGYLITDLKKGALFRQKINFLIANFKQIMEIEGDLILKATGYEEEAFLQKVDKAHMHQREVEAIFKAFGIYNKINLGGKDFNFEYPNWEIFDDKVIIDSENFKFTKSNVEKIRKELGLLLFNDENELSYIQHTGTKYEIYRDLPTKPFFEGSINQNYKLFEKDIINPSIAQFKKDKRLRWYFGKVGDLYDVGNNNFLKLDADDRANLFILGSRGSGKSAFLKGLIFFLKSVYIMNTVIYSNTYSDSCNSNGHHVQGNSQQSNNP